jgi:ubiquinone/menaquinone biosynthesis C-methylase UbiE
MKAFVSEVERVLKPGGFFLFSDFRQRLAMKEVERVFAQSNLNILADSDITPSVLTALDRESDRKSKLIEEYGPRALNTVLNDFAATRGSKTYDWFQSGDWVYKSTRMQRAT